MKLIHEETSLVLAGAWNPAILTPIWVLQYGLNRSLDDTNRYQTFLPTGLGLVLESPRYVIEELTYTVRPDSLIITPKSEAPEDLNCVEDAAARMLAHLKHTPMGGVGHNFEFRELNPQPSQLDIFTHSRQGFSDEMPEEWEPAKTAINSSFTNAAKTVLINVQHILMGNEIVVKVNFHHAVSSVEQAISVLQGEQGYSRMTQNLNFSNTLLASLFGDLKNE